MTRTNPWTVPIVCLSLVGTLSFNPMDRVMASTATPDSTATTNSDATQAQTPDVAITGNNSVDITWNYQADPVNIYMNGAKVNSSPYQGYDYAVSNLTPGQTYQFVLTTVVGQTESSPSPVVTVTMMASPQNVVAIPSDRQVKLSWDAVDGATDYNIYSSLSNGTPVNLTPITGLDYTVNNLTNGEDVTFWVNAVDATGHQSLSSKGVTATPFSTIPPTAPMNLTAVNGDQSVDLSWNASNNHGQLGQVTYDVYENGSKVGSSNSNSFTVSHLNNGQTYTFSARAINNLGFVSDISSPFTDEVVAIPQNAGVSVAPTSLTLHWDRPTEQDIVGFNVIDRSTNQEMNPTLITANHYTITGLEPQKMYYYYVQSVTASGAKSGVAACGGLTDISIPTAPSHVTAYADNFGQVHLSWTAAPNAGVYHVYQNEAQVGGEIGTTSYVTSPLARGTYRFNVSANNAAGKSDSSETVTCTVLNHGPAMSSQFITAIYLSGHLSTAPYAFVMNNTTYMPLYYVQGVLTKLGIENTWNGSGKPQVWDIRSASAGKPFNVHAKSGTMNIYLNGRVVEENIPKTVAPDPYSHQATTYVPIWYVQQLLNALDIHNVWDGRPGVKTWTLTK